MAESVIVSATGYFVAEMNGKKPSANFTAPPKVRFLFTVLRALMKLFTHTQTESQQNQITDGLIKILAVHTDPRWRVKTVCDLRSSQAEQFRSLCETLSASPAWPEITTLSPTAFARRCAYFLICMRTAYLFIYIILIEQFYTCSVRKVGKNRPVLTFPRSFLRRYQLHLAFSFRRCAAQRATDLRLTRGAQFSFGVENVCVLS